VYLDDLQEGNSDNDYAMLKVAFLVSCRELRDSQIILEAKVDGYYSAGMSAVDLRTDFERRLRKYHETSEEEVEGAFEDRTSSLKIGLELLSNANVAGGSAMLTHPNEGPVAIEIIISGVLILAHISNNTRYTMVSKSVVDNFGFKRIDSLKTKKMRDGFTNEKVKDKTFTCLEDFSFFLGGKIPVRLRNAMEGEPDLLGVVGITLGMNLFFSGALCLVDVFVGETSRLMRTDGFRSYFSGTGTAGDESLRHHSFDGASVKLPIFHLDPFQSAAINILTIGSNTLMNECSWCRRRFPNGMLLCAVCQDHDQYSYYFDTKYQGTALKVHKLRFHKGDVDLDGEDVGT